MAALESTSSPQVRPVAERFIQRPSNVENPTDGLPFTPDDDFTKSNDHSYDDNPLELTTDVADELPPRTLLSSIGDPLQAKSSLIRRHPSGHEPDAPDSDMQSLLSQVDHIYPPAIVASSSSSVDHEHSVIPPERSKTFSSHTPVPAVTVFSRKAAPLFLPKLDNYLAALPPPSFHLLPSRGTKKHKDVGIFPPMDRLVASGRTLSDLETNSTITPPWRRGQTVLGGLRNLFLGIMVR